MCLDKAIIIWQVGYVPIIGRNLLPETEAWGGGNLRIGHFMAFDMVGNVLFDVGYISVIRVLYLARWDVRAIRYRKSVIWQYKKCAF